MFETGKKMKKKPSPPIPSTLDRSSATIPPVPVSHCYNLFSFDEMLFVAFVLLSLVIKLNVNFSHFQPRDGAAATGPSVGSDVIYSSVDFGSNIGHQSVIRSSQPETEYSSIVPQTPRR